MILTALTDQKDIELAYAKFEKRVTGSYGRMVDCTIGWPDGTMKTQVKWHSEVGVWSYFDPNPDGNHYWCTFGMDNPQVNPYVDITCEINMVFEGIGRRVAGRFAKDTHGEVYLLHSGKVGGGRPGIGKTAFRKFFKGDQILTVAWPDGDETYDILIGSLSDPELIKHIGRFVNEVAQFKKYVTAEGKTPGAEETTPSFSPEFTGTRKTSQRQKEIIKSIYRHGEVVNGLYKSLVELGLNVANDQMRDVYIHDGRSRMKVLFEVKTDLSTSSIYGGIGQLMFHGACQVPSPKRVFVVPSRPNKKTSQILERLKINWVTYKQNFGGVSFNGLKDVIS